MADFTPIGNTGKTQEPFGAVNSILGIAGKAQELKIQGFALQQAQNFTKFQKNFDIVKYMDKKTGILDASAAYQGDEFKNAGNAQELAQQYIQRIQSGQAEYKTKLNTLNDDALANMYQRNFALSNNPDVQADNDAGRQAVRDSYAQLKEQYPTAGELLDHFAQVADPVKGAPKNKLADALYFQGAQGFDTANAREQFNPQPYTFPDGTQGFRDPHTGQTWHAKLSGGPPGSTPPAAPGGPPRTAAPAGGGAGAGGTSKEYPGVTFYKPNGEPKTAEDDKPPTMAPKQQHEQYWADAGAASQYVHQVHQNDDNYATNTTLSNAIRRLAGDTKTGPGSSKWQSAIAAIGSPLGIDTAPNYQTLNAMLERQAATLREQMHLPGTNLGSEQAQEIAGSTSYGPATILAKNELNQALVEGLHQYRKGLDHVVGFSGQPSPKSVAAFQAAWADNMDPMVFQLENARKRLGEDPEAVRKITNTLSSDEAKELMRKRAALQRLSHGKLP